MKELNDKIHIKYDKYNKIYNSTTLINFRNKYFIRIMKDILNFEFEIKNFFTKVCVPSLVNIISIMSKSWQRHISDDFIHTIKFYNSIFVCSNTRVESKYNFLKELKDSKNKCIFFKKQNKDNYIFHELNGAILHLFINNKIIIINGYFANDNLNIIKNNSRYKKKIIDLNKLIRLENICEEFSKKYIEQLSLRDFIINSINELSDKVSIAYEKLHFYKDMSLTELLLTFNTSTLDRQREMLTILILSDNKSANLASLLYDVILKKDNPIKAKQLYLSLHTSVQKLFDLAIKDFNDEIEKLKKIDINDISYDKKIAMCNIDKETKLKALEKFRQLKGNNGVFGNSSNDAKVETWLNGFLKIPFNNYKKNQIITFLDTYPFKLKELLYNLYDKYKLKELEVLKNKDIKKIVNLEEIIKSLGKMLMIKKFGLFYNDKIGKLINNWNEYKLNRKMCVIIIIKT